MRIAMLTELFPPSVGGQEVRFAELATALSERGHSVDVLAICHADDLPRRETLSPGVTIHRRPYIAHYRRPQGWPAPRSLVGIIRYALAVRSWLARERFDLIFMNQWPFIHILTVPRRDRSHAVIDWCEIRDGLSYRLFQNLLPRLVAANTAVSTDVQRHIRKRSAGPVLMLPSGIMRERYRADPAGTRRGILYLGRLAHHKGVLLLIPSYDELCRRGCTEPLIIAGGGPAEAEIRAAIAASPNASRISMPGAVSEDDKVKLLAGARVLVLPSQREGFPRVVAEAMASFLPTVTTRYPGNGTAGVVEEFACGLVADPTPAAIADATERIFAGWDSYSAQAGLGAARLDWGTIVAEFEEFVGGVCDKPVRAGRAATADLHLMEH